MDKFLNKYSKIIDALEFVGLTLLFVLLYALKSYPAQLRIAIIAVGLFLAFSFFLKGRTKVVELNFDYDRFEAQNQLGEFDIVMISLRLFDMNFSMLMVAIALYFLKISIYSVVLNVCILFFFLILMVALFGNNNMKSKIFNLLFYIRLVLAIPLIYLIYTKAV